LSRKFYLGSIEHPYKTIEITVEGDDTEKLVMEIDVAFRRYLKMIEEMKVA
jgi:hypothetical protein